jgi:hypothetical protein
MESLANNSTKITTSNELQLNFRNKLWNMRNSSTLHEAELERNPALFLRSPILARIIALNNIYQKIVNIPGSILDLGCWWGQNSVLFENFRSIYEPFNKQRKIIAFDTFEGYTNWSQKDQKSEVLNQNTYSTSSGYENFLKELLETHEGNNNIPHIRGCHEIIKGDATITVPGYFQKNPDTIVAMAAFDLGLYNPTKTALEAILPQTIPGSILIMLHLTRKDLKGDATAFLDVISKSGKRYEIFKESIYPSFSVVKLLN